MDIRHYKARTPQVTEIQHGWVRAFVGDDIPRIGDALGLRSSEGEEAFAAVRRHAGGRQVIAMMLSVPEWVGEGTEVFTTGQSAHVPAPRAGTTALEALAISAGEASATMAFTPRSPSFEEMAGSQAALTSGYDAIDRLAPLSRGGVNLILDAFPGEAAFDHLTARVHEAARADANLWLAGDDRAPGWADYQITAGVDRGQRQLTALRVLASWATQLRDGGQHVLLCAELPPLASRGPATAVEAALGVGIGEVVDQLGSALASTREATITTVLRLPLHTSAAGIESIIETMDVGDVDAQVYIDNQGRFDPYRSTSDADLDADARSDQQRLLSVLSRAASARDKAAMLGEFGLEEAEEQALRKAEGLREKLVY